MKRGSLLRVATRAALQALAAALAVGALTACGGLGDPVVEKPPAPPRIAYDSSMTFYLGAPDARAVRSTGGPVSAYAIAPPLSPGLTLDPVTGELSGAAYAGTDTTRYTVTATGPGGTGSATFDLHVVEGPIDFREERPSIAYATPRFDTLGRPASHPVLSTGGPVTAYAIHPAPPPGLSMNTATGLISGTPSAARAAADHQVIAIGPGGRDTAVIRIAVAATFAPPRIAYASPVFDTLGVPARHAPLSTGGPIASYTLLHPDDVFSETLADMLPLPFGLTLDPATGVISGTPATYAQMKRGSMIPMFDTLSNHTYSIVATGPGGKDTAQIRILVSYPKDWVYPDPLAADTATGVRVTFRLDSLDVLLSRLVVSLTANTSSDKRILDTIVAGTQGFAAYAPKGQSFTKAYAVRGLRSWMVYATAYDAAGRPTRTGTVTAENLKVAEKRAVQVDVTTKVVIDLPMPDPLPRR